MSSGSSPQLSEFRGVNDFGFRRKTTPGARGRSRYDHDEQRAGRTCLQSTHKDLQLVIWRKYDTVVSVEDVKSALPRVKDTILYHGVFLGHH